MGWRSGFGWPGRPSPGSPVATTARSVGPPSSRARSASRQEFAVRGRRAWPQRQCARCFRLASRSSSPTANFARCWIPKACGNCCDVRGEWRRQNERRHREQMAALNAMRFVKKWRAKRAWTPSCSSRSSSISARPICRSMPSGRRQRRRLRRCWNRRAGRWSAPTTARTSRRRSRLPETSCANRTRPVQSPASTTRSPRRRRSAASACCRCCARRRRSSASATTMRARGRRCGKCWRLIRMTS